MAIVHTGMIIRVERPWWKFWAKDTFVVVCACGWHTAKPSRDQIALAWKLHRAIYVWPGHA